MTREPQHDPRVYEALSPTPADHETADRIVDDVLADGSARDAVGDVPRVVPARRWVVPAAAAAALVLAAGVALASRPWTDRPPVVAQPPMVSASPGAPQVLTIRCTTDGPQADEPDIAAAPDGVYVRFVNETTGEVAPVIPDSGAAGHPGWRGVSPDRPWDVVLPLPPGVHPVSCDGPAVSPDSGVGAASAAEPLRVTVQDPHRYWRGSAADAGCALGGIAAWAGGPGRGDTPEEAIRAWPSDLPSGELPQSQQPGVTIRAAEIGYAEAATRFWILSRDGRPSTLITVSFTDDGGLWEANGEWFCAQSTP